ncbi:hypothetical protein [Clostridium magnum]|uniref:Uncharacterized protein n=1 Tax=Clostridium magnum DSM 2767 TaxID=1121326 RepID=A0A161XG56_9CLOT|nr:hypothetical protein [Clostridium magnum]KZL93566.1 hypothetical protein CLMAG_06120 [Clostridium magnum DSM 2767]SHI60181.1 hypothetical protein SAMN02745944_04564 [Clostridium magnum DSM 2767]
MLIISNVEYSKNPVKVNEAFLISVTIVEQIALWSDAKGTTWGTIKNTTWQQVKLKYF